MDWFEYKNKLGFSVSNVDCDNRFVAQIHNFFDAADSIDFTRANELLFCNQIGVAIYPEKSVFDNLLDNTPVNLQRAWEYMKGYKDYENVLFCIVSLHNTYQGTKTNKSKIKKAIFDALIDCHINYEIIENSDSAIFVLPKGAKELDIKLVSEPLDWILNYPKAQKLYELALKEYIDDDAPINIADNLRKTLEIFMREFFDNSKNLDNNIKEVGAFLKSKGAVADLSNLFTTLITHYNNANNEIAKHNDKATKEMLEFLLYQTGIFIRTLIVLK